jgi:hypothetical protein
MGGFKAHGPRLGKQLGLGPTGLVRQIQDEAPAVQAERLPLACGDQTRKSGSSVNRPRKGGRPRTIEGQPWEKEGVSRRTWERRRKGGA